MYYVKVIADSISSKGDRLTTIEARYPRIIHAELLTHRMLSRNSSSSRSQPVNRMRKSIIEDPFIPFYLGKNQSGMQAREEVSEASRERILIIWDKAMRSMLDLSEQLEEEGLHKQLANRLLEPFSYITTIISATDWENFFALRCHPDAQPEISKIAEMIRESRNNSTPEKLNMGEWHLPYLSKEDIEEIKTKYPEDIYAPQKISSAKCARVSYLTHNGIRDFSKDIELFEKLNNSIPAHRSPTEHIATPMQHTGHKKYLGNFCGWIQFRKKFIGEDIGNPNSLYSIL